MTPNNIIFSNSWTFGRGAAICALFHCAVDTLYDKVFWNCFFFALLLLLLLQKKKNQNVIPSYFFKVKLCGYLKSCTFLQIDYFHWLWPSTNYTLKFQDELRSCVKRTAYTDCNRLKFVLAKWSIQMWCGLCVLYIVLNSMIC